MIAATREIFKNETLPEEADSDLAPVREIIRPNATATRIAAVSVDVTILTIPIESEPAI